MIYFDIYMESNKRNFLSFFQIGGLRISIRTLHNIEDEALLSQVAGFLEDHGLKVVIGRQDGRRIGRDIYAYKP